MINLERCFWRWIEEEGGLEEFARSRMNMFALMDEETSEMSNQIYFTPEHEYHGYSEDQAVQAEMAWLMQPIDEDALEDDLPEDWDK